MTTYTRVLRPKLEEASNQMDDGKAARRFRWVVEIEVDEIWVADGFDLTEDRLEEMVLADLSFARSDEVAVKVLRTPDPAVIREAQGYTEAEIVS